MRTNLYVIWDSAAECYNAPFALVNDQVALRAAQDLRNDPTTDICRSPQDFTLFRMGSYDDSNAQIDSDDQLVVICKFHELTRTNQPSIDDQEQQS